jgi:hypothetical protein
MCCCVTYGQIMFNQLINQIMEKIIKSAIVVVLCFSGIVAIAQNRNQKGAAVFGKPVKIEGRDAPVCASAEYEAYIQQLNPNYSREKFENWLAPKVVAVKNKMNQKNGNEVITLPVVVHIIHTGEEIGTGKNLNDEQVLSQITVLNQDYRRAEGTSGYNENPVGADVEIEFCLAQRDPEGNVTNGITRTQVTKEEWTFMDIEMDLKPDTQWNPEKYINIWVLLIAQEEQLAGYAFPPMDTDTPGLEDFTGLPETSDGIVIDYRAFGSEDFYPEGVFYPGYTKGRTTTHEMGHFLGLRHVWGDEANCTGTDYCDDTPQTTAANTECSLADSCPESDGFDMIENYMDYTPDVCQNTFTQDQKARMLAVIANSQQRSALLTSNGCVPVGLGLNENNNNSGLILYPNPAHGVLNIALETGSSKGSYVVYNSIGQVMISGETAFEKEVALDIASLSNGVYIIKLNIDGETSTKRFVKE